MGLKLSTAAALLVLFLASSLPAYAAATPTDLINAIYASRVLDESARVNVRIDGATAHVSTYRQAYANENDCKIDAVLIARAIIADSPDISRVVVYFYASDLIQYNEVSVTAGDVQAFGSGATGKDQLLSSLVVQSKKLQDDRDRLLGKLESTSMGRSGYKVAVPSGDKVVISTYMGSWVSDSDAKLESLRIAVTALGAMPTDTKSIVVSFIDPAGKSDTREASFSVAEVEGLWRNLTAIYEPLKLVRVAPTADVQVKAGPLLSERQALFNRIQTLAKKGIGMGPFLKAFSAIEDQLSAGDEATIKSAIERLNLSLDDQDKASKSAKEPRTTKSDAAPTNVSQDTTATMKRSRWALGDQPIIEAQVLANPDAEVRRMEAQYARGFATVEQNPKFLIVLDEVSKILRHHNRIAEATRYEQRAQSMRARGLR